MKDLIINVFFKVLGVSSASGIIYSDGMVRLISDDSNYLYEYVIAREELSKTLLKDGLQTEQIIKSQKLDLEAIVEVDNSIFVFGSGSTYHREIGLCFDKKSKEIDTFNLHDLYGSMRDLAEIKPEDFNIEGVAHTGKVWLFFNRGNGPNKRNVIFTVLGNSLESGYEVLFKEFELPTIDDKPIGFSDAIVVDKSIYFIATAEEGNSTYHDGPVAGSIIGIIDIKNMNLQHTKLISYNQKFEGIAFYAQNGNKSMSFLLCEDNDDKLLDLTIYKIDINI